MVTTGADHSMMDRSLMILENEHALLEDKQTACENLERYFNQLLQNKTDLTPLKIHGTKVVKILLQYVEQESENKLTIPALTALRPAVELIAKNVSFSAGMKLASLCYEVLLKSYRTCDTSCQAGILVEMFRCMSKFNDAQFFEAVTSRKAPYAELKEVCESFMSPCASSDEMDLNRQAVRLEALRFLKRFLRVAGGAVLTQIEQEMCYWVDLLLQHMFILFKENNKVGYREMEVSIRQEAREILRLLMSKVTPGAQLRSERWVQIKKDIRDVYADIMVKMVGTSPEWSEQWILVLQLLDKELITKGNNHLINKLLNVEERAFKYDKAEVRIVAFTCWCHLIDKFVPDDCENYRESVVRSVRLLMQPLQANNARTESIAVQKLYTWWHLMHRLESSANVLVTTVISPFLVYCFGSPKLKDQCPGKKFFSLHLPSAQSLLFILDDRPEDHKDRKTEEIVLQSTKQKIAPFRKPLLNSVGLFLVISEELIFSIGECITILSSGNYEGSKALIKTIWQFLLEHIQKVLKSSNDQSVKVVQDLLRLLRQLTERETSTSVLLDYYVNILLEDVVKSAKALPTDVLAAPMYYVGKGPRFMAGTPALLLVECMMSEQLLPLIKTNTRYVSLLKYLVNFGIDHCNTLDFIQAVMKIMESVNSSTEEICLLWNIVASACIKYLKSGGQVNQGSDHQHDFTYFYVMLMFPLHHICSIPYSEACEVVLVWHELYKLFCGVAKSTVTSLDVVEIQETVASKLNQILVKHAPKAAKEAIAILKVTQDIVNSVPFSEVFGQHQQSKKRGRTSCGISNVLNLVMKMPQLLNTFERVEEFFNTSWALLAIIIDVMFKNIKQINATSALPVALQLSDTISALLQMQVVHDGTSRFCSDSILRMWKDYLRFMETSLSKKSLKDTLSWLCSLLEFGFKNTLLEVRTATIEFWDNCLYPLCHKEGIFISKELQDLREKCGSTVARNSVIVADSEDDNASDIQHLSSNEGRANKENICNSETDVKQMNDGVFAIPEVVVKGKSKSLVQQLKDDGHVLTRHQKEILRSKKDDIPALYSSTLQPEQDSQYSQNSESSQDTLEFTGPSRILEPVVEETIPTPDRSLKVLEPPSSQRRLAEYRKKMMIDDEGSIILTAVSKEPVSDLAVPVTSSATRSNEADKVPDLALLPSENSSALNNRKLNLESVAVPMLSTVLTSNNSVSMPEVTISISNPPVQTSVSSDTIEVAVENNIEHISPLKSVAPDTLHHLVKSTNGDTSSGNTRINAPVLLQNYVDFPPALPKTNLTGGPVTELQNISAEHKSSKNTLDEKENKTSVNYFKAVSIALVDDDDEEEEDDNIEMLNISTGSKCDNTGAPDGCENEMSIQETNQSTQGDVDAVKVVVEKVEDFSLNKTFAALETIVASTFDSAGGVCSPNTELSKESPENGKKSTNKIKERSTTKDPVELDLQKLFESPNRAENLKEEEEMKKYSQQQSQKSTQHNSRSRSGRRSKKDAKNSADKSTTSISPSLITGSKSKIKQCGKLTADISKSSKFTPNSASKNQCTKEEEINKEKACALLDIEVEAPLIKVAAENSISYSLSDNLLVHNIIPAECKGLIKDGDTINNKSDVTAKSNISGCDNKVCNTKRAHDQEKEKSPLEKRKRKRNSSVIKENTEQKTKRARRSKLPSQVISTFESDKDNANKAIFRPLTSEHPVSKNNHHVKNDSTIKDSHPAVHNSSVVMNNDEKHNFGDSGIFKIGKNVLSSATCKVFSAGEEHKLGKVPNEVDIRSPEKSSLVPAFPHSDNINSLDLMTLEEKCNNREDTAVTNLNISQKNDSLVKRKSKLIKKGVVVETAEKKGGAVLIPLRKLRSAGKGGVSTSLRVAETVNQGKVSENITTETDIKSSKSPSTSGVDNKDISSQVNSLQKFKSNKPSKNEAEVGDTLSGEKEQEPSESQDVVESSQSSQSPSIFSWNNLKTCSVVVKKLETNLEPGSKVNLDENLILLKTPDHLSPYKVCSQELNASASAISTTDKDRFDVKIEKAKKNFQNVDGFSDAKVISGSSEVDETVKSVPKTVTDLNSSEMSKEKSEAFVNKKCGSSSPRKKSKSSVISNSEPTVIESCALKKASPAEETPQTKSKKTYIQTLITEAISNANEGKEKHELKFSSREGVKTRHQKVTSQPSAKVEAQSKEKACPLGEETKKAKSQITGSPTQIPQTKLSAIENEKDNTCKEQVTNSHPFSAPKLQTEINSPTKQLAVIQSCNTKSVPQVADNSAHKPQPASSEPFPACIKFKSCVGEPAVVKKKLSLAEVEMTSSNQKINIQSAKVDILPTETGSEEQALNSIAQKVKAVPKITNSESVKEQNDENTVTGKDHVQTEAVKAQLAEMLKTSESEKKDLKSKLRKTKLRTCTPEIVSVGIKENVQPPTSIEEIVKSKADKSKIKLIENKLSDEGSVRSKRKQKLVVSANDNLEKSTELATSDNACLLNTETSKMNSSNQISEDDLESSTNLSSDACDKQKRAASKSGKAKETSVKLKQSLSKMKLSLPNDASEVANSESASTSEIESSTVLQTGSTTELHNVETSSKFNKVNEALPSFTNKEDTVQNKIELNLLTGGDRPRDAESQGVTGQEAAVATAPVAVRKVEKIASNMQHTKKESDLATGRRKRRGRPPNLDTKRLLPLSRKRTITKESPNKTLKSESETTPKTPKMRKLFNTDGHADLIFTPISVIQSPKSKALGETTEEALSAPTSSKSIPVPLCTPENSSSALSSMENSSVPVSTTDESLTPAGEGPVVAASAAAVVEDPTPASEDPTSAAEGLTAASEDPTAASEDPTAASEDPTPGGEGPTPTGEGSSPEGKDPAPAGEDPTPADEDPPPAGEDPTLAGEDPTLAGEDPTPENLPPPVQTSAADCSNAASSQASPLTLSSSPSISAVLSLASCPLSKVSSSETSPPKFSLPKTSPPKLSSPKSLLNSPSSLLKAFSSSPSTAEPKQSRTGHHGTLAGRAQFMVGLALVSKEGKSASESAAKHDSKSPATKTLFSLSPNESASTVDSPVERQTLEFSSTPMKRRSLLMDPKRRLNAKKKRVSFSETPQTILYECHVNEKKRTSAKNSKTSSAKSYEELSPKQARPEFTHDNSDDEVMIIPSDSEVTSLHTTVQDADSPDLTGLLSQGSVQEVRTELLNSQQPIFPQLINCIHPVEAVVAQLTNHPMWTKAFLNEMYQRNIRTIGDLSRCDEVTINRLPIPVPKVAHTKKVLQDYQRTLSLLPRRGFWHSVGSRLLEQEGAASASSPPANTENPMQRTNVTDCAKFLANNPKSLHAVLEEAVKIPHAQEKLRKEIETIREELLNTSNAGSMEVDSQQHFDKMAEYVLSHREQFLNKIPVLDLCKHLATRSPEETEKWILECLRTYLRAGSFSFLEKLNSPDNGGDLLNIIQSYIMVKRPIADILEGMPQDGVLHFATSKLSLADKMIMCAESLVTDNTPASPSQLQKLMNAIVTKMKMSGALDVISQLIIEKLKSMDL